jgi:hypothetical protein
MSVKCGRELASKSRRAAPARVEVPGGGGHGTAKLTAPGEGSSRGGAGAK